MKHFLLLLFSLLLSSAYTTSLQAQGCSDAGICSFHKRSMNKKKSVTHQITAAASGGLSDEKVIASAYSLGYSLIVSDLSISVNAGYAVNTGDLGTFQDFNDVSASLAYNFHPSFQAFAGGKFPLSNSNQLKDGKSLPMVYQASLGTVDLLVGSIYSFDDYSFTLAYQQPFTDNENGYTADSFDKHVGSKQLVTTTGFKRSSDILFRVSRNWGMPKVGSFYYKTSLLSLYHLGDDRYVNTDGKEVDIENSGGLTLNLVGEAHYTLDKKSGWAFKLGFPVKVREVRPDGTTRGLSAVLEYSYKL